MTEPMRDYRTFRVIGSLWLDQSPWAEPLPANAATFPSVWDSADVTDPAHLGHMLGGMQTVETTHGRSVFFRRTGKIQELPAIERVRVVG